MFYSFTHFLFNIYIADFRFSKTITTDTIFIKKAYKQLVIKLVFKELPSKFYIYKRNTFFRKKIVRDTLITGIEIISNIAKIHTIRPISFPLINEFPLFHYQHRLLKLIVKKIRVRIIQH